MKIVITGATGLLGRAVLRELKRVDGFDAVGTGFSRAIDDIAYLDLRDGESVRDFIATQQPQAIIHSAAERRPDISENDPDATRALNVQATQTVADAARSVGSWVIYISTDYVFDGTSPPYTPDAQPNPLNFYGRSKLEGEEVIRESGKHCILRVPVLYGPSPSFDESPITLLGRMLIEGEKATVDHWATRYPTLTTDVAVVCRQLLEHKQSHPDFAGTFHWSGDEAMTKFDIARVTSESFGLSADGLTPDPEAPAGAPRPKNSQLDCSTLEGLGIGRRTPFQQAIVEVLKPFLSW